ncbi:MAG: Chromosome partition protein Smc [Nitrospira sp.]
MYLKSLEMSGFKSFAEAKIEFPEGVTAVVGPNGSGKSNVVDAILWVLGEQSTKTLRSEKMEDVIFNGTELRKPLGMAEVSLVIGGLDHIKVDPLSGLTSQLAEYQELMITRRLYRNGDSEYLINKTACRLKDIRSVLLDTRAGTKGHTVIAQGQIDQILNASPQDRRELIEETAGIVRYKKQKAEALRKLDATQQNLLRVRDIIGEVKKQLNSLERQARQARSYQVLQQEARSLEIALLTNEYRALRTVIADIEKELGLLTGRESEQASEQAKLNVELERVRLAMAEAGDVANRLREELARLEHQQAQALTSSEVERHRGELYEQQRTQGASELERAKQEQEHLASAETALERTLETLAQELLEQEQTLAGLDQEMKTLTHQRTGTVQEEERARVDVMNLAVLVANAEQTQSQLAVRSEEIAQREHRLGREREELDGQRQAVTEKRRTLLESCEEAKHTVGTLREQQRAVEEAAERSAASLVDIDQRLLRESEELAAADSHWRALQDVLREDMGYGRSGDEEATALKACEGVHEAIAEWLEIPAELDRAVEAWLGERVRGWLVDGPAAACRAIEFLSGKDLGRGTFIPYSPRWRAPADEWWPTLAGRMGVIGRAADLISVQPSRAAARDYLFDRVVFVETLQDALSQWETLAAESGGPVFVTKAGEIVDAAGAITGGQTGPTGGLLQRRREVLNLESRRAELTQAVEEGRQRRDQLVTEGQQLRDEARRLADLLREAEMSGLSLQKDEAGLEQILGDLTRRIEALTEEAQRNSGEAQRLQQEARVGAAQLEQWMAEKAGQERSLAQVRARLVHIEENVQGLQQRLTAAQLAVQGNRTAGEHHRRDVQRIRQQRQEGLARIESFVQQLASLEASLTQSRQERLRYEELCRELGGAVDRVKADVVQAQERQAQDLAHAHEIEIGLERVREVMTSLRESRLAVEVRRAEVRTQLGTVESTLTGTYQVDLSALSEPMPAAEDGTAVQPAAGSDDDVRQQLQKIRERLDRMGPINLAAISEHEELETRHQFLSTQEQDLSTSMASLKEIIQRINRTTKDMFASTFAELQEQFGVVFSKFFPGGRAELQLVEATIGDGTEEKGPQDDPGVEIVAQPPGKRLKNITMLSGGEKTLTAMALLFASFLIRPTPFCILDEIDAPLDEENIGRFTGVLRELAREAQFMVITHNKRTMAIADSLFGVTMEEPGISKLVSVRLADLQPA